MQEICSNPKLYVDGVSRMDVVQGILGKLMSFSETFPETIFLIVWKVLVGMGVFFNFVVSIVTIQPKHLREYL